MLTSNLFWILHHDSYTSHTEQRINLQDGANRVMENEDLSAVVSEIVKHTRTHLLPQLLCWRDILMESESVLQTRLSDNATSHHQSSTIGKRTRDMCEENDGAIDSTLTKKIDLFQGKIKIIDQYINRVKIMLDEKCKYLTKDAFALKVY